MSDPVRLKAALASRYAIERELGQGGMATVYLAHDLRHDRRVAVKVLRPELSAILGAERFLHEIKTTANLQHPHILSLFDSGEADGLVYYVMPYIEGESLRDRLTREKQLPVDDAVRIAREVADALQYAHEQGVVHRDIKPENILLRAGHAMVADFGIALAAARSEGGTRMTETGMSLGTPFYMSPEQAMGEREITPRADIYALGCVTYEMLAGEPPFTGPTAQAIIARVMTEDPRSLTAQRRTIPPHVEAAIERALQKLPADRFASAKEFADALGNPAFATSARPPVRPSAMPPYRRTALLAATAAALLLAGVLAGMKLARPAPADARPMAFTLALPDSARFVDTFGPGVAVSQDGAMMAYVGGTVARRQLFIRRLDDVRPVAVPGTEGAYLPFFSPDGEWIGFVANQRLMKVRIAGGRPVVIASLLGNVAAGATWSSKGVILLEDVSGLSRVSASGGRLEIVVAADTINQVMQWPAFLPDGEAALLAVGRLDGDHLGIVRMSDGKVTVFDSIAGTDPRFVAPGYVVWASPDGTLLGARFDATARRFSGPPVVLLEGVVLDAGAAKIAVGPNILVQVEGGSQRSQLLVLDRKGNAIQAIPDELAFEAPRFSPDGRRIAVGVTTAGTNGDVWVVDRARRTRQRVTFDEVSWRPEWSTDARRLVYGNVGSTNWDVLTSPSDGSGQPESLVVTSATEFPYALSAGDTLVFARLNGGTRGDILYRAPDGSEHVFAGTPANESQATLSPDGRWVAYASDESGRREVFVRPFPAGAGRWQISTDGGVEPRWSRHGREIIYRSTDFFLSVPVETGAGFSAGRADTLFRGPYEMNALRPFYDVSADGSEIVIVGASESTRMLTVRTNALAALLRGGR